MKLKGEMDMLDILLVLTLIVFVGPAVSIIGLSILHQSAYSDAIGQVNAIENNLVYFEKDHFIEIDDRQKINDIPIGSICSFRKPKGWDEKYRLVKCEAK